MEVEVEVEFSHSKDVERSAPIPPPCGGGGLPTSWRKSSAGEGLVCTAPCSQTISRGSPLWDNSCPGVVNKILGLPP